MSPIGEGSGNTLVFDGIFSGRHVAVKRVNSVYNTMLEREKDLLLLGDEHV